MPYNHKTAPLMLLQWNNLIAVPVFKDFGFNIEVETLAGCGADWPEDIPLLLISLCVVKPKYGKIWAGTFSRDSA